MRKKINLVFGILLVLVLGSICFFCLADKDHFKEEGVLKFLKSGDQKRVISIKIEIAETKSERRKGLMNRKYLDRNNGMLFVYEDSKKRSFWMKDTTISLDIIYINKEFKVVSIYEKTQPLLKKGLPSIYDAKYVIEVNAGFCENNNIKVGDSISYKRI